MKKIRKHNPVKALKQAFQEEWNDNELHENYQSFERDLERAKEAHNELVPQINNNIDVINTLKESVLSQALCGVLSPVASDKIKELEAKNTELIKKIEIEAEIIEKNKALMQKYEDWSDRKLFIWWQAIKAVDPETEPWIEWLDSLDSKIF